MAYKVSSNEEGGNEQTAAAVIKGNDVAITLSKADLLELIRAAKEPNPREQAKIDAEEARLKLRRERRIRIAKSEEASRKARQKMCRHRKPNGEESSGGQPFSDGRVRMFCLRCQTTLREYWTPEIAQGIALAKKMEKLGVTDADIREAADFKGDGELRFDEDDDFALRTPRGHFEPDLTTDAH